MRDLTRMKWRNHKWSCNHRGLKPLTYEQYVEKLADAGITASQVGRTVGAYQLARYTDKGDYTPETCRFVLESVNREELRANGGLEIGRQKHIGRTKFTHEGVARQSDKMRGRTAATHPYLAESAAKAGNTMRGRTKHTHASHASQALKTSCEYAFVDPSGILHTGRNLSDFARANGLHIGSMSKLRTGKLKSYHGWKLAQGAYSGEKNASPK